MTVQPHGESPGVFDRFASMVSGQVAKARFFVFAALLVVVWAPSILIIRDVQIWQLIINTVTTIGTWLLVSLLENTTERADRATQAKLNAVADGLADLLDTMGSELGSANFERHAKELREAVGLEDRVAS